MQVDVFIEGASDAGPAGNEALAARLAERFGIPAPTLLERLRAGRFRVKSGLSSVLASQLTAELEALGARVSTEELSSPGLTLQPLAASPAVAAAPSAGHGEAIANMPALELSALDERSSPASSEQTAAGTPMAAPPPTSHDAFLPPEATSVSAPLELGDTLSAAAGPKEPPREPPADTARTPPPSGATSPAPAPAQLSSPTGRGTSRGRPGRHRLVPSFEGLHAILGEKHSAFFTASLLSLAIGFLPAHFSAALREKNAYSRYREELERAYAAATTPEAWDGLGEVRAGVVEAMLATQRNIAVTSIGLWLMVAAGLLLLWRRHLGASSPA